MIIRKADANTEAEVMPTQADFEAMGRYNEQMLNDGVFIDGTGLKPSSYGARIDFHDGQPVVTDGPFTETKELIAGFTLFEAASKAEAIERVKQWPPSDGDGNVSLELRQLYEMADFEEGEGLDVHKDMDARMQRQPASICPHLSFEGNCAEALTFYAEVLGGDLQMMMTYRDSPMASDFGDAWQDKVIHGTIAIGKLKLSGCDVPPGRYHKPQGLDVQISFPEVERARAAFCELADQGTISMPFEETFWSKGFGMVTDRFGIAWMVNTDSPNEP
ncbi:YciI family protein [Microbulbifer bruguierae]|uniref:YciI family protein n=1 Tax=Microbulbifer bruguierae TaxID=3029061 RepID=A0ABY8NLP3_9GAMM|nr:YciI family protein [Microbulbifer bruguierae]WGL18528.1 YciI family protein [Microbulbifer bruguierae]